MWSNRYIVILLCFLCQYNLAQEQNTDSIDYLINMELSDPEELLKGSELFFKFYDDLTIEEKDSVAIKIITNSWNSNEMGLIYKVSYRQFYFHKTITYNLDKELFFAQHHYNAAVETKEPKLRINRLTEASNNLGIAYQDRKEYYNAINYYQKSVEYSKKGDYPGDAVLPLINIANIYGALGDLQNSLKYLRYSLPFSELETDTFYRNMNESFIYLTISRVFYEQNNMDSLKFYSDKIFTRLDALNESSNANVQEHICNSKLFLVKAYIKDKKLNLAKKFLDESLNCKKYAESIYQLTNFDYCLARDCPEMTALFLELNQDWAKDEINTRFEYFLELKEKYFNTIRQYDKAYLASTELRAYQLNELSIKKTEYAIFADSEFENTINQEKLKNVQLEKIQQEKLYRTEKKAQRRIIYIISLFLALLCGSTIVLYRLSKSRKRISSELKIKNQELSEINKSKTWFYTNLSHELKTPLTLILNPLQKLARSPNLSEENKFLIKTAEKNSLDLLDLTTQMLELTSLDISKIKKEIAPFNFPDLLHRVYADFESVAKNNSVLFKLKYDGSDHLTMKSDRSKLRTVLKNLISNALKFTSLGDSIEIAVKEKENIIQIEIHDSGRGIHSKDIPYIFNRYYQASAPETISEGGNGIGLAICKEYISLLDGSISVRSEYGSFTTFSIEIPKVVATEKILSNALVSEAKTKLRLPKGQRDSSLPTIMIVEDNIEMMAFMLHLLSESYNILTARNGFEGLKILQQQHSSIDLIISDVMMPVMNGFEFLEKIKTERLFATIPFLILTALSDTKSKLRGLRANIDDYITKPFIEEELIARIENLISNLEKKRAYNKSLNKNSKSNESTNKIESSFDSMLTPENELEWLTELEYLVDSNLSDHNFTVDNLAFKLAMSRSLLYRKVKQLTGLTPNNYISQLRYSKARFYLENKKFSTVKEVAYHVGFKDEKYFSRNFKMRFGKYPSSFL